MTHPVDHLQACSYSVVVITEDFESSNACSNHAGSFNYFFVTNLTLLQFEKSLLLLPQQPTDFV